MPSAGKILFTFYFLGTRKHPLQIHAAKKTMKRSKNQVPSSKLNSSWAQNKLKDLQNTPELIGLIKNWHSIRQCSESLSLQNLCMSLHIILNRHTHLFNNSPIPKVYLFLTTKSPGLSLASPEASYKKRKKLHLESHRSLEWFDSVCTSRGLQRAQKFLDLLNHVIIFVLFAFEVFVNIER